MIEEERIRYLNNRDIAAGSHVLYWMQASQRVTYNHALAYAIRRANEMKQPLIVFFGLTEDFPEANERHYHFMLQGLKEVRDDLCDRGIGMIVRTVSPEIGAAELAEQASLVVCDRGYLRIQKEWRHHVAEAVDCPVIEVESEAVVPVEAVSGKEEYLAATLRRKIVPMLSQFIRPLEMEEVRIDSTGQVPDGIEISDTDLLITSLDIDHSVMPASTCEGGTEKAESLLDGFIREKLDRYDDLRNDPTVDLQSGLSPYLHFGQISPVYIARVLQSHQGTGTEAFLEELIVRRELSFNYCQYNKRYDSFSGLPDWAVKTLRVHQADPREYVYSADEFEEGITYDRFWNAAQHQMVRTGKMHGYMRMYWGKKILEWSESPEKAFDTALYLNNKYSLDGRDPNSFAGIAWCFGKHDRPWGERPIFGNVRYMNANGLKRKFDIEKYAEKWI